MKAVVADLNRTSAQVAAINQRLQTQKNRARWHDIPLADLFPIHSQVMDKRRQRQWITEDEDVAVTVLCERSLAVFCREAWHTIEPSREPEWNWHHGAVCEALEAVTAGIIRNLLINMPPRHSKSTLISILWPAWEWIGNPGQTFLTASHSYDLAIRDSSAGRRCIESQWYQKRWGAYVRIAGDQNQKERYRLTAGGHRIGGSPGGIGTGDGGNRLIADDLLKIDDRFSEATRRSVNVWFSEVFSSRVNDPRSGSRVVVGQRLHQDDIFGNLLPQGGWEHLSFAEEYESSRRCAVSVPGFNWDGDPRTTDGELLWPDRFGPAQVEQIKKSNTPSGYAALYQQRPSPAGGGRFKREWFRDLEVRETDTGREFILFDPDPTLGVRARTITASECRIFGAIDPAAAEKTQGNRPYYTAMVGVAVGPQNEVLVFDVYRKNVSAPTAIDAIEDFQTRNHCDSMICEKNGLGLPIFQMAVHRGVTVRGIDAVGNKESRAEAAEIHAQNGKVYVLRSAPWREDFLEELEQFPAGEFADQVDAFSHAVRHANVKQIEFETDFEQYICAAGGFPELRQLI